MPRYRRLHTVVQGPDGGVILFGSIKGAGAEDPGWIMSLSRGGETLWQMRKFGWVVAAIPAGNGELFVGGGSVRARLRIAKIGVR